MNNICYIRVNDRETIGGTEGIDTQTEMLKTYLEERGIVADEWVVESRSDQTKFNALSESVLYVSDECILAKTLPEWEYIKFICADRNLSVVAVGHSLTAGKEDQISAIEEFIHFVKTKKAFEPIQNHEQLDSVSIRTANKNSLRSRGHFTGGRPPYGYYADNGELKKDPEEGKVINLIFKLKRSGKSISAAENALNMLGVKSRKGTSFSRGTLQNIWYKENTYKGYLKMKDGTWVKGEHEPYLDEEGNVLDDTDK